MVAIDPAISDFHPAVIAAATQNAERQAKMVAWFLEALEMRISELQSLDRPKDLPAAVLLEIGAICQIKYWERVQVRELFSDPLPTFGEAVADFCRRLRDNPEVL